MAIYHKTVATLVKAFAGARYGHVVRSDPLGAQAHPGQPQPHLLSYHADCLHSSQLSLSTMHAALRYATPRHDTPHARPCTHAITSGRPQIASHQVNESAAFILNTETAAMKPTGNSKSVLRRNFLIVNDC